MAIVETPVIPRPTGPSGDLLLPGDARTSLTATEHNEFPCNRPPPLRLLVLLGLFLLAISCQTSPTPVNDLREILKAEARDPILYYAMLPDASWPEIHLNLEGYASHPDVARWLSYFSGRGRTYFARLLERGRRYRPMIHYFLRKEGLPLELYYMALIESGFTLKARSSMQAVGLWQFMPGTGRRYGLQIDSHVDERIDPVRATIAAARYFRDLHAVFPSWMLAMAAYGAGEMRIVGAIMKTRKHDYWKLCKHKALPPETRAYIPKFIAAVLIGQDPHAYGFSRLLHPLTEPNASLAFVRVPGMTGLATIARATHTSENILAELNPHLLQAKTPPGRPYHLWFPFGIERARTLEGLLALERVAPERRAPRPSTQLVRQEYRVKRGDTLTGIARRYRLSVQELRRINRLKTSRIQPGQRLLLVSTAAPMAPRG